MLYSHSTAATPPATAHLSGNRFKPVLTPCNKLDRRKTVATGISPYTQAVLLLQCGCNHIFFVYLGTNPVCQTVITLGVQVTCCLNRSHLQPLS